MEKNDNLRINLSNPVSLGILLYPIPLTSNT
jgi:hypothetical protein